MEQSSVSEKPKTKRERDKIGDVIADTKPVAAPKANQKKVLDWLIGQWSILHDILDNKDTVPSLAKICDLYIADTDNKISRTTMHRIIEQIRDGEFNRYIQSERRKVK